MNYKNIFLSLLISLITLLGIEMALNAMIKPSETSSGMLFGKQLPPLDILPRSSDGFFSTGQLTKITAEDKKKFPIINEKQITEHDLWGIMREDPLIGYAPKEDAVSPNDWWQSNNLGARSRHETSEHRPPNKRRMLFFGDSYTQGSRVPQEETIQHYINSKNQQIEAINFGVDGYSMGQAYLRFMALKDKLEYDHIFLIFVPTEDLWRDINVIRYIGEHWPSYMTYPRFIIANGHLELIASPYRNLEDLVQENHDGIKPKLRDHLQKYDDFYFRAGYQTNPILDKSVLYRVIKAIIMHIQRKRLTSSLQKPNSDTLRITRKIIEAMRNEVVKRGSDFSLVILPTHEDLTDYSDSNSFKNRWQKMVSFICTKPIKCINLMRDFEEIPTQKLDHGYDGTHFGPKANKLIANFIINSTNSNK